MEAGASEHDVGGTRVAKGCQRTNDGGQGESRSTMHFSGGFSCECRYCDLFPSYRNARCTVVSVELAGQVFLRLYCTWEYSVLLLYAGGKIFRRSSGVSEMHSSSKRSQGHCCAIWNGTQEQIEDLRYIHLSRPTIASRQSILCRAQASLPHSNRARTAVRSSFHVGRGSWL